MGDISKELKEFRKTVKEFLGIPNRIPKKKITNQ